MDPRSRHHLSVSCRRFIARIWHQGDGCRHPRTAVLERVKPDRRTLHRCRRHRARSVIFGEHFSHRRICCIGSARPRPSGPDDHGRKHWHHGDQHSCVIRSCAPISGVQASPFRSHRPRLLQLDGRHHFAPLRTSHRTNFLACVSHC